jgi:glycosyltransferase involved in cell wall biosynthesis
MLIIFATHPIQYQVPLWRKMTEAGIKLEVWYFTDFGLKDSYDVQFGKSFSWNLPMLEGYAHRFIKTNAGAAPNQGFKNCRVAENIKDKLKSIQATHVYINGWHIMAYWQALWSAKSLGLKTIFKGESNDLKPESKWKWPLKKLILTSFFKRIDYFLYIGEANKRLYQKYNIPDHKLLPGLYCIENDRFFEQSLRVNDQKDLLRSKWGVPTDAFCILFSGKFIPKKRPLDIVLAAEKLIKNPSIKSKIHLLFVGDGLLYNDIVSKVNVVYDKEKGLINQFTEGRVNASFTGFINQMEIPIFYAIADCLILPSDYGETWGLVANEAMATGLPVIISSQCGSAEDLLKPILPNLVFETGNIDSLYRAIEWLIINGFSKKKVLDHIQKYSYSSTINSTLAILTDAVK